MATAGRLGPMEIPKPLNAKEEALEEIDKRDIGCAARPLG